MLVGVVVGVLLLVSIVSNKFVCLFFWGGYFLFKQICLLCFLQCFMSFMFFFFWFFVCVILVFVNYLIGLDVLWVFDS